MRIVVTDGGRDRIVNELILLGRSIVCCFNLITSFTD